LPIYNASENVLYCSNKKCEYHNVKYTPTQWEDYRSEEDYEWVTPEVGDKDIEVECRNHDKQSWESGTLFAITNDERTAYPFRVTVNSPDGRNAYEASYKFCRYKRYKTPENQVDSDEDECDKDDYIAHKIEQNSKYIREKHEKKWIPLKSTENTRKINGGTPCCARDDGDIEWQHGLHMGTIAGAPYPFLVRLKGEECEVPFKFCEIVLEQ